MKNKTFEDPITKNLAEFIRNKQAEITQLIERAQGLALELQPKPLEFVLCHTDIHGGNMMISDKDELYIVDWDAPILAPKERELMFIGGGMVKQISTYLFWHTIAMNALSRTSLPIVKNYY